MTVLERIKEECRIKKNISITTLEHELGYSNGSLAKAKDIPSSRISEIAKFLNVSMDYLMTGKENEYKEIGSNDAKLLFLNERVKEYALKLAELSNENQLFVMQMIDKLQDKKGE